LYFSFSLYPLIFIFADDCPSLKQLCQDLWISGSLSSADKNGTAGGEMAVKKMR